MFCIFLFVKQHLSDFITSMSHDDDDDDLLGLTYCLHQNTANK